MHLGDPNESEKRKYYYTKYDYDNKDIFSGKPYKELFEYIDEYTNAAESESFRYLVDVFKENYKALNSNDSF